MVDIGSGLLAPHPLLPDEPDAATVLRAGAALVTASGDKLLGGPQAGVVLGRSQLIEQLRRHPAALESVDWFNHRRLHSACDDVPPAEFEEQYYRHNRAPNVIEGEQLSLH